MGSDFQAIPIIGMHLYLAGLPSSPVTTVLFRSKIVDISAFLEKIDDPRMGDDKELLEVIRQLDDACKEAGFFYVTGTRIVCYRVIPSIGAVSAPLLPEIGR
ncbi:hypothetical protein C4D60_Mb03t20610 [Musa balbisiana]|uniref:Uncharacterized protein n=1 Tax=Musa balbisiana TaxID=52838 RepID=A0A4S8JB97_MUSBA|nr:hypothetical protein C4D60_Mb03t20610 [Musa balbisiana]